MGNNRNLVVLLVLLVGLGALYLFSSGRRAHVDTTGGFVDLVETQLSTDDVYGIRITHGVPGEEGSEGFEMVKRGDEWFIADRFDAPANLNKIRTLLGNLESLEGELRSDDASVLADYALDDASAYHLVVRDEGGKEMVSLLLGERSGRGCFVREAGSNRAMLGSHNFLSDFGVWGDERKAPDVKSWIDLVAFQVDRNAVQSIEWRSDRTVAMQKEFAEPAEAEDAEATDDGAAAEPAPAPDPDAYEWRVTAPSNFLATKTRADGVLNNLTSLRARDVAGRGEGEWGLGDDADRVIVTTTDGTTHTLLFGGEVPEGENLLYFQVEGEDLVWTIPSYLRDNVFKSPDDLKAS